MIQEPQPSKDAPTPWPTADGQESSRQGSEAFSGPTPKRPQLGPDGDSSFVTFLQRHWPRKGSTTLPEASTDRTESKVVGPIGRFQVLEELGSGGFATVYRAHDPLLNCDVALKIPHPEVARSDDLRRRFEREARAAASLDHPHINPIHETSKSATELYIASHYCTGPTLAEWLKHRLAPVSPRSAAGLVAALADAVQHAHDRGILHRDLKPSNVLLDPVDPSADSATRSAAFEGFTARLSDFGLAKLLEDTADEERTRTGMLLGTPRYMSPEQAIGDYATISSRTDVYSLGVILYELLVGRPPFVGDTELETLRQIRFDEPISVRRLQPKVPRELDTICSKCLEKDPQRRYASARELALDLRRFVDGLPIQARPRSLARRARLWTTAHPVQAAALAGGLAVLIGLPAGLTWHTLRLERAFRVAEEQRVKAQQFESQARASERKAVVNAENVEQLVYASDMRLANLLLKEGDFHAVGALVDRHDPALVAGIDRRGFEWSYYRPFGEMSQSTWPAHAGALNLLTFSADGSILLTASNGDRLAKSWDVATRTLRAQIPLRNSSDLGDDRAGALTPDGALAATVVDRDTVAVWNTATGEIEGRIKHADRVRCVVFSPDGQRLLTGGDDASRIWRRGNWDQPDRELVPVRAARFSPDGRTLAIVWAPAFASHIHFLDATTGEKLREISFWRPVLDFAYSPNGRILGAVCDGPDGTVIGIYNPETGAWLTNAHWRGVRLKGVSFSFDGRMLATVTPEGGLRFWRTTDSQASGGLRSAGGKISEFSFSPDHSWLATSAGGSVSLWSQSLIGGSRPLQVAAPCAAPVVFSPREKQVAVAGTDGSLLLIDAAKLEVTSCLQGHLDQIVDIAYSSDGRWLASVDGRGLRVWSQADGTLAWQSAAAGAMCVSWSPDGATIATGGSDHLVQLWDLASRQVRTTLTGHQETVMGARFTADGRGLFSYGKDGAVHAWDIASGKATGTPYIAAGPLSGLAVLNEAPVVAIQSWRGDATLSKPGPRGSLEPFGPTFKWPTGNLPWFVNQPGSLTFTPDGKTLGHAGPGDHFAAEDIATGATLYTLSGRGIDPTSGAYSADGQTLATVGRGHELTFWNTSTWHGRHVFGAPLMAVKTLAFSGDSDTLFVASDNGPDVEQRGFGGFPRAPNVRLPRAGAGAASDGTPSEGASAEARSEDFIPWQSTADSLRTWDVASGREQRRLEAADTLTMLPALATSPARNLLAAAARDGTFWIWDTKRGALLTRQFLDDRISRAIEAARSASPPLVRQGTLPRHDFGPRIVFPPDGSRMLTLDDGGTLRIWNTESWEPLATVGKFERAQGIFVSPDGARLVVLSGSEALLCDAQTARLRQRLRDGNSTQLLCGGFSPDSRTLALGTAAGQVELYDIATGKRAAALVGHLDGIGSLAYSPDGRTLATGGWDATVRLWDVASGREVAALEGHRGRIHTVAFSPNGKLLASGGEIENGQGEVFLWRGDHPLDKPGGRATEN
ncbi:MAG: WD40 repeat domain-containing serine/threonine protein kinase [Pirellulales bacterium]